MLFGRATFIYGQHHLLGRAEPPSRERLRERTFAGLPREWLIYLLAFGGVAIGWQLIQRHSLMLVVPGLPDMSVVLRSEEHTSELQSLMRISYAVFCLKKKK